MPIIADGCYFWIDCRVPEDERRMSVLCTACRDSKYQEIGAYWDFKNGCGPWDVICGECEAVLYKHSNPEDDFMKEIDSIFNSYLGSEDNA